MQEAGIQEYCQEFLRGRFRHPPEWLPEKYPRKKLDVKESIRNTYKPGQSVRAYLLDYI
ncbi:hypothetical protein [Desulfonatronospira sp.]|uniref:hypothetical protein n=1 Tax=Desulfonatronospira sp. TaxID=1962951 RepID=UPI0025B835E5|nr:hypothetical protein [Desulfonatronospira sp.]